MDSLLVDFLGKPIWSWIGFLVLVLALLIFDLGVLHRKSHEIGVRGIKMLISDGANYSLTDNRILRFVRRRFRVTDKLQGERFLVRQPVAGTGKALLFVTPLFLAFLPTALSLVLIFLGCQVIPANVLGLEKLSASISLGVPVTILIGGIVVSLWRTRATAHGSATAPIVWVKAA